MLDTSTINKAHVLDQPVAASFKSQWRSIARRSGSAWVLPSDVGPFAAQSGEGADDEGDFSRMLAERGSPVIVLQKDEVAIPKGAKLVAHIDGFQMVYDGDDQGADDTEVVHLSAHDARDMHALARLTEPGPFEVRTHVLGEFIGVKKDGHLVAMAGQRMQIPGWTEISAVCVHPNLRHQGLGARLVKAMCRIIERSGHRPFLHACADNTNAIRLYKKLGFRIRSRVHVAVLTHQ